MGSGSGGRSRRRHDRGRGDCRDRECLCGVDVQLLSAALLPAAGGDLLTVRATAIGLVVFALVSGSALLAIYVQSALPQQHLNVDSKDVVKLGVALIATMSALVLGLLVASATSAYDTRSNQLVQVSADIILIDRALARQITGKSRHSARSDDFQIASGMAREAA